MSVTLMSTCKSRKSIPNAALPGSTEYSTMYHELPFGASFWPFLLSVDQDLAQTTRQKACPCGGRLHRADYPRKPRGAEGLPEDDALRFSFCCASDGCRKRVTPPSV